MIIRESLLQPLEVTISVISEPVSWLCRNEENPCLCQFCSFQSHAQAPSVHFRPPSGQVILSTYDLSCPGWSTKSPVPTLDKESHTRDLPALAGSRGTEVTSTSLLGWQLPPSSTGCPPPSDRALSEPLYTAHTEPVANG